MCLIIASPQGEAVPPNEIDNIWSNNPHGFGIMWAKKGRVQIARTLRPDGAKNLLARIPPTPYVAHWRWATHGDKTIANVHPFRVHERLGLAHNGVISGLPVVDKAMSDTWHFVQKLRSANMSVVDKDMLTFVEKAVGVFNKIAFLDADGVVHIANERQGDWQLGKKLWYSNLTSRHKKNVWVPSNDTPYYPPTAQGRRHSNYRYPPYGDQDDRDFSYVGGMFVGWRCDLCTELVKKGRTLGDPRTWVCDECVELLGEDMVRKFCRFRKMRTSVKLAGEAPLVGPATPKATELVGATPPPVGFSPVGATTPQSSPSPTRYEDEYELACCKCNKVVEAAEECNGTCACGGEIEVVCVGTAPPPVTLLPPQESGVEEVGLPARHCGKCHCCYGTGYVPWAVTCACGGIVPATQRPQDVAIAEKPPTGAALAKELATQLRLLPPATEGPAEL